MDKYFSSAAAWQELLNNDFNRGYLAATVLILVLVLVLLALKIVWAIVFRTRRCRELTVPAADGDVLVSHAAIAAAVTAALGRFPALAVREVRLYRRGRGSSYFLVLDSSFDASGAMNFSGEVAAVKQRVFDTLREVFGIDSVRQVRIRLEKLSGVAGVRPEKPDRPASLPFPRPAGVPEVVTPAADAAAPAPADRD